MWGLGVHALYIGSPSNGEETPMWECSPSPVKFYVTSILCTRSRQDRHREQYTVFWWMAVPFVRRKYLASRRG